MKRHLIPALALLLLVGAVPLLAQSAQPPGHMDTPGATAATGEVVSINSTALVIRTDSGETRTFLLDGSTVGIKEYPAGTRVKVDFVLDDQSRSLAKVIMGPGSELAPPVSQPSATLTEPAPAPEPAPVTEPEPATEPAPVTEPEEAALPETASELPLVGLLGLLALAAGLGLHAFRRS